MPPYDLDQAPGFWMNLAFNRLRQVSLERLGAVEPGLTPEQWALMVRLWADAPMDQADLVARTFRDKAGVSRLVSALEGRGWVTRQTDPADKRRRRVHLTEAGRAQEGRLVPVVRGLVAEAFAGVDDAERAVLRGILKRVVDNLEPVDP